MMGVKMKRIFLAALVGLAVPVLIVAISYVQYSGSIVTYDGVDTFITAALDTNRLSGTQLVRAGLYSESAKRPKVQGCSGWVTVGDLANAGDAAFGNVDTAIITYYTTLLGYKQIFETDTIALLPGTSYVWDVADSVWDYSDAFYFDWYLADSTEDYAGSDDTIECTMNYMMRVFEE
jgi:hypothetical protein